MSLRLATPALDAWLRRARQSADGFGPTDALWRAACWESAALEASPDLPGTVDYIAHCLRLAVEELAR